MQGIRANRWRRIILECIPVLVLILSIVFDQLTKVWCDNLYNEKGGATTVIENFFYLTFTVNTGAAFSFLADKSWAQTFFKVITAISLLLFVVFYVYAVKKKHGFLKYALAIIIAGTIGNFIDRIMMDGVRDFLSFVFWGNPFAIFNIADACLTVGVIMLIIHFLFLDESAIFRKKNGKEEVSD
jgi:signal peptidase II